MFVQLAMRDATQAVVKPVVISNYNFLASYASFKPMLPD